MHKALHIERVVIVTPSVYGTDNSATLFGMKARGATARGVAVIDDKTPDGDLEAMNQAGIRGIRLNLATGGTIAGAVIGGVLGNQVGQGDGAGRFGQLVGGAQQHPHRLRGVVLAHGQLDLGAGAWFDVHGR